MNKKSITKQINRAKEVQRSLEMSSLETRNHMLKLIMEALIETMATIIEANNKDIELAKSENLSSVIVKRLIFNEDKIRAVVKGIGEVITLGDPLKGVKERRLLDEGLLLEKIPVSIGVIGMIFESRPDALVQIISLALKSGNAIVLKGGKEALQTNTAVVKIIKEALQQTPVGGDWIVHLTSREDVSHILTLNESIDLLIPRGSNQFVQYIMKHTSIPVLGHSDGLCAMYIDNEVDMDIALSVAIDSKCQYPSVCNAIETLLVHTDIAHQFIPLFKTMSEPYKVIIHGDDATTHLIEAVEATDEDWDTEYLDYEIAIKVVSSMEEAIEHITFHGSKHTDCIITTNNQKANEFMRKVDSADVFHNCSTRFADGNRFGLGAEVGISTQKIHARGPVGLDGLVTTKWLLRGNGHIVASYEKEKNYLHQNLDVQGPSLAEDRS
ncbi:MAG: glutamate-5-semialdehyde dehydrogenase [Spirochaetia bacterium]|nr:glutamate-5-semialdehyde dehydrogenase [Spirochaetia bacterium]